MDPFFSAPRDSSSSVYAFASTSRPMDIVRRRREVETSQSQLATVSSPNVTMRITDRQGDDVFTAQVGDPLALRFEIIDSNRAVGAARLRLVATPPKFPVPAGLSAVTCEAAVVGTTVVAPLK
ncbi:hypothetical protein HPB51_006318 [Rhipicephalus microplus]|uniref:Uncharacterized protein n=1 Tax=Rhipicephalus microplus TaxID=6941 RepID=A0A9J6EMF6_RHIMP|nr:hypothetical protein HPB51_006318 [Rhipicephalus microplus]